MADQTGREIASGAGLGLLVGTLVGLSTSSVVGPVIGALAAVVAAFLGFKAAPAENDLSGSRQWRTAGFGFACVAGLVFGIFARANDWLGEPPNRQVKYWIDAGATREAAVAYVAYERLGIKPTGSEIVPLPRSSTSASVLFASHDVSECTQLARDRFASPTDRLRAMQDTGGVWQSFAGQVESVAADKREELIEAGYRLVCAH